MSVEVLQVEANGMNFYVERRGSGPVIVLVPAGNNDCGPLKTVAEILAKDFLQWISISCVTGINGKR